jgi:hypothetical protein
LQAESSLWCSSEIVLSASKRQCYFF